MYRKLGAFSVFVFLVTMCGLAFFLDSLTLGISVGLITAACFTLVWTAPIALSIAIKKNENSLDRWIGIGAVAFSGLMLGALYLWCEWAGWVHNTPREHGIIWYLTVALMANTAMFVFLTALLMLWYKEYRENPRDQPHFPFVVATLPLAIFLTISAQGPSVVILNILVATVQIVIAWVFTRRGVRILMSLIPSMYFFVSGWYWLYVKTLSIPEFISSGDAAHPGMEQFLSFGHFVLFGAVPLLLSIVWFAAYKPKNPEDPDSDEGITPLIPINPGDQPYKDSNRKRLSS